MYLFKRKKDPRTLPEREKIARGIDYFKQFLAPTQNGKTRGQQLAHTWKFEEMLCLFEPIESINVPKPEQQMMVAEVLRQELKNNKKSMNKLDKLGLGLLHWAILKKNPEAVRVLIEEGITKEQTWYQTIIKENNGDTEFEDKLTSITEFLDSYFKPKTKEDWKIYNQIKNLIENYINSNKKPIKEKKETLEVTQEIKNPFGDKLIIPED